MGVGRCRLPVQSFPVEGRMEEHVVLVDECDREIGTAQKLAVHTAGLLHRSFSVFVFDSTDNLLLQRRARTKYHSAGRWANTCCGHPRPGETVQAAAARRLVEEMGFSCPLRGRSSVLYRVGVGGGLVEHEYDHIFVGRFDGTPAPSPHEVEEWRWSSVETVADDVLRHADHYASWFPIVLEALRTHSSSANLVPAGPPR
jgi:isopentenyl-diphosphate Delta-isomerase